MYQWEPEIPIIDDSPPPADDWVFLCGLPRTGSTVASELLSLHPDASVTNEWFPWGFVEVLSTRFYDLPSGHRMSHFHLSSRFFGGGREEWKATEIRSFLEGIWDGLFEPTLIRGDKQPGQYFNVFSEVEKVFPGVRYVIPVRDPWDTAASLFRRFWKFKDDPPESRSAQRYDWVRNCTREELAKRVMDNVTQGIWKERMEYLISKVDQSRRVFLRFEQMSVNLEQTLTEVLTFLDLDPTKMEWDAAEENSHYPSAVGRWKDIPVLADLKNSGRYDEAVSECVWVD